MTGKLSTHQRLRRYIYLSVNYGFEKETCNGQFSTTTFSHRRDPRHIDGLHSRDLLSSAGYSPADSSGPI